MTRWAAGLVFLVLALPVWAQPSQDRSSMVTDPVGTAPIDFTKEKHCIGGTGPLYATCTVDADCPGSGAGRCAEGLIQAQIPVIPSWAARATEQRTMTGSAIDAFSTAVAPCWYVRVKNIGTATLYVGYSGVTNTNGVPVEPGESWVQAPGADLTCNSVKLYGASGGKAAVVTP